MHNIRAGTALAKTLKKEGVQYVFTVAVSTYMPFYAGCIDEGIQIINLRHEQAAGYAADAWGRITREPGICWAIGGCGTANMTSALIGAYYECSPLVAFFPVGESGEPVTKDGESKQFSASRMFEHYSKWAKLCSDPAQLPTYGRWAFRHATAGRMGPAIVEMPYSTLYDEIESSGDLEVERYRVNNRFYVDTDLARKALRMLIQANRPVIVTGNGVHWSNAFPELRDFARLLNIPVVSKAGLAQGYFPEDDSLFAGVPIGFNRPNLPAQIVPKADVVMTIGSRFEVMSAFPSLSPDAKLIQIDVEPTEIGRSRLVDLGIVGDAKAVLSQLIQVAGETASLPKRDGWLSFLRDERAKYEESIREAGVSRSRPIKGARLVQEVARFLDKDAYVIIDGADIGSMGRTYLRAQLPGHFMIAHGDWGNMGPGLAFGIGTKLAKPKSQVVVLTSDGSFGFNAMELETASKYGIKLLCIVSNNRGWGAEVSPAIAQAGKYYKDKIGVSLPDGTRYDQLAQALGCYGELVVDPEDIRPALRRAEESEKPALLDVRVSTEDMWPTRTSTYPVLNEYLLKKSIG